jgi:hypothetical protein
MKSKYYIFLGIFFLAFLVLGFWKGEALTVYIKAIVI